MIVTILGLGLADPLAAQRDSGQAKEDSVQRARATLPVVQTTVLRGRFDLYRVPFAVDAVGADQIHTARVGLALDDALRNVPGVQVDNRFNYALGERINVRGFGARAQFGVRGVKILMDGIPLTLPDGQSALNNVDLGTIGRAEVVRGPMASLYGNAAGGVIQLQSLEAPNVPISEDVRVIGGSDGMRRAQMMTAGTRGAFDYSLAGSRLDYAGYRDFNSARNAHVSGVFGWRSASDDIKLIGNWVDYRADNPGGLSASMLAADRRQAVPFNLQQHTGENGKQGQYGLSWQHALSSGHLEASAYTLNRGLDNPIPPRIVALDRMANGARVMYASGESIGGLPIQLNVGAESDLQRDDRQNYANVSGARGSVVLNQLEHVRSSAGFAQFSVAAGNRTTIMTGARYDRFRFSVDDRLVTSSNPDDTGDRTMSAVSPSLGVAYALAPSVHLYANVATSFETPTTTELANRPDGAGGFNPTLKPQHTRSVEGGMKGQLGGSMSYQLATYRAAVRDALVPFEVPNVAGRTFYRNAGRATHRGVEGATTVVLTPSLVARVSYTYVDARFDEYTVDTVSYAGNRVPGVAPHHGSASVTYENENGGLVSVEGRASSAIYVDDANRSHSPGYAVVDVRLAPPRLLHGMIAPFAGVMNVLGTKYNTSVVINATNGRFYEPGPGREIYVGMDVSTLKR